MKNKALAGAILMLAIALLFNAGALLLNRQAPTLATPAMANVTEGIPGLYYLGRDTYFITSSSDGNSVYLWYYDFSPRREDNRLYAVDKLAVPK